MTTDLSLTQQADILEQAADYITVQGHCKNGLRDYQGRVCIVGAVHTTIQRAMLWDVISSVDLFNLMEDRIGISHTYGSNIVAWNNAPERTQGEVEDLLRSTAKDLRNNA